MKKPTTLLTTAFAALLAVAGCSSGDDGGATSEGREDVVMWGSWSGEQVDQLEEQAAAFNESQDQYEVSYVSQELVEEKLLTGFASGDVPDVVLWDRYQTSLYAPKGALAPIDDYVSSDGVDTGMFYEPAVEEMTVDGTLYGLPLLVDNRSLFYNTTLLDEAGVDVPDTWSGLKDAAEALTVRDGGTLTQAGFDLGDPGLFNMWLAQAGGHLVTEDETATAFNSPEGLDVLRFWQELLDAGVYEQGFGDGIDAFAEGSTAMKLDGPWALTSLDAVDGLEYGVAEPPRGPNGDTGAYMGGFGLVIPEGATNADGAWEFIKWWTTQPENGVDFGRISGWIPANVEAANDPYFTDDERYAAFIETMNYAQVRPSVEGYSDVEGKALVPALEQFLSGELSAEQALNQAQEQGDRILADAR
ncbi:ABC transporter substrate-binding protein [Phytoactinopolyspora halotolerans]|uniref:ABC transporter substrate-binding protein n=1 Tax=Phytoactinopolyspora halotolerans TaxID=1981512 RepID=A0A6L9SBM1_9ACTN|nr:ABC transporter substrate-binding protein [Phytoactinopolyspora halotolerans]NEE01992.1 ABC transporter substrate-binding protein [Phytoactinopolyspora halotolerans]